MYIITHYIYIYILQNECKGILHIQLKESRRIPFTQAAHITKRIIELISLSPASPTINEQLIRIMFGMHHASLFFQIKNNHIQRLNVFNNHIIFLPKSINFTNQTRRLLSEMGMQIHDLKYILNKPLLFTS